MAVLEFTELTKLNQQRNTKFFSLFRFLLISGTFFLLWCCSSPKKTEQEQTIVSGKLNVLADESFKPVLEAEKMVFEALYKDSEISIKYVPEITAFNAFLKDSVELIFAGRNLTEKEKDFFKTKEVPVTESHFATDALAFVINKKFNNSLISFEQLQAIISGKFKTWKEVNQEWAAEEITLVFDQSNSANLTKAIENFGLDTRQVKIFAAGSNEAIADYVAANSNAIGIMGAAWLSDEESPTCKKIREKVSVVTLINSKGEAFAPTQSSIYFKENPFARKIYLLMMNKNMGLSTGFSSFVLSDRGQRVVLKTGLLPAIIPEREIVINNDK